MSDNTQIIEDQTPIKDTIFPQTLLHINARPPTSGNVNPNNKLNKIKASPVSHINWATELNLSTPGNPPPQPIIVKAKIRFIKPVQKNP